MNVIDELDFIKIHFDAGAILQKSVYNREYFLLMGIKIVESEEEKKIGGLHQYKKKDKTKKSDFFKNVSDASDSVVESVEKGVSTLKQTFDLSLLRKEIVIKKNRKYKFHILFDELQEMYNRSRTILNFESGLTYNEYAQIIKDLYIQLAYLKFLKLKIDIIDLNRVFKINGRYVLLANDIKEMEENEDKDTIFKDLEIKKVELTGKKYEKGEIERDLKEIEGTEIEKMKELYEKGRREGFGEP